MALPDLPPLDIGTVGDLFEQLGVEMSSDTAFHFHEMLKIFKLYCDRNASYKGVWQQYGALNNLVRAATKVDRLMAVWWTNEEEVLERNGKPKPLLHKDGLDDAADAINYLLFFMRCAMGGNMVGGIPRRPQGLHSLSHKELMRSLDDLTTKEASDVRDYLATHYGDGHA